MLKVFEGFLFFSKYIILVLVGVYGSNNFLGSDTIETFDELLKIYSLTFPPSPPSETKFSFKSKQPLPPCFKLSKQCKTQIASPLSD